MRRFLPKPKPPPGQPVHACERGLTILIYVQVHLNPRGPVACPEEDQCEEVVVEAEEVDKEHPEVEADSEIGALGEIAGEEGEAVASVQAEVAEEEEEAIQTSCDRRGPVGEVAESLKYCQEFWRRRAGRHGRVDINVDPLSKSFNPFIDVIRLN